MTDLKGTGALITGASSGFGVDFAALLAQHGCNLVLVARRTEQMAIFTVELRAKYGVEVFVEGVLTFVMLVWGLR